MSLGANSNVETIPLGLLRRYLAAHGWRRAPDGSHTPPTLPLNRTAIVEALLEARSGGRRNFDLYVLSEDGMEDVELVLPREQSASDFLRRMEGAIRTLSDLEGREPGQIITDVRMVGYDVVRSHIPNAIVHGDTVHLEVATNYVVGMKGLLASTATTEMHPTPHFLRIRKEASEYADRCRFAHTFRGSFGFSIESPVAPNDEPTFPQIYQPRPFERRVIERLARGIRAVCDAVDTDDVTALVSNVKAGFNANACEQFAKLVEDTSPGGLMLSFAFSPEWKVSAELTETRSFTVGPRHIELTKAAAKLLRRQVQPRAERVIGRVVRLESDADPSDMLNPLGEREVAIQWSNEEFGDVQVRVSLGAAEYLLALEAHKEGRPIMVSGTLERKGLRWIISNPTDFAVP